MLSRRSFLKTVSAGIATAVVGIPEGFSAITANQKTAGNWKFDFDSLSIDYVGSPNARFSTFQMFRELVDIFDDDMDLMYYNPPYRVTNDYIEFNRDFTLNDGVFNHLNSGSVMNGEDYWAGIMVIGAWDKPYHLFRDGLTLSHRTVEPYSCLKIDHVTNNLIIRQHEVGLMFYEFSIPMQDNKGMTCLPLHQLEDNYYA